MNLTEKEVIQKVLETRYFAPGEKYERQMYVRVAGAICRGNQTLSNDISCLMQERKFLPNSPTLVNAGTTRGGTLSACFVLPIEDSLEGIDKACVDMGKVHKAFGGTGFNFGHLRAKGTLIRSTGGKACGPVKVLQLLDAKANMVGQGGKREGGNMGILPVDHPDIMEWITCKKTLDIRHFNLSVAVTNEFMDAATMEYADGALHTHETGVFDAICQNAWERGCPGLIFIDKINEGRPIDWKPIEATNPCGEQPLGDYESCNLGSLNLGAFVVDGTFCSEVFKEAVETAVRFLDKVIDENNYPIEEIQTATLRTRNIGLGIMGWADYLIKMGIPYASEAAIVEIDNIGQILRNVTRTTSRILAEEYGPYPVWQKEDGLPKQRNYSLTTIAPTGTLSKLAKCSPGIEPVYDWHMEIFTEQGVYNYHYPYLDDVIKHGLEKDTALRIPIEWHIKHQAAWQKWIDNAVSKTINLPEKATVEEVRSAFWQAYRSGCKGITIYRDRSKTEQVLSSSRPSSQRKHKFICRPGRLYEVMSGCGKMFIWIDEQSSKQHEVFVVSSGGCAANNESTGRVLSDEMQYGIPIPTITRPLKKVKCINAMKNPNSQGNSCSDIIGQVIDEDFELYYCDEPTSVSSKHVDHCPQCDAVMIMTGGCSTGTCPACGWSGCS